MAGEFLHLGEQFQSIPTFAKDPNDGSENENGDESDEETTIPDVLPKGDPPKKVIGKDAPRQDPLPKKGPAYF